MNNLQPLKWTQKNLNPLAELEMTAYSALHEYVITEPKQGKFELKKTRLSRPDKKSEFLENFDTVKEAKDWAWAHYQRSMQPYVKPMPTWISVDDRLPEEDGPYFAFYPSCIHERQVISFSSNIKRFNLFHDSVTHWMLLPNPPEFSTMQDLHKGGDCE